MAFRISPELRERLVAAAGDRPIGEEIRQRLEASFALERGPVGDPQTLALVNAIITATTVLDQLANYPELRAVLQSSVDGPWYANPVAYAALSQTIARFMATFRPEGEADPAEVDRVTATALAHALSATASPQRQEQRSRSFTLRRIKERRTNNE